MGVNFDITESGQDLFVVGEKLWLTADRERVVKDGDPDAAFLLCAAGNEMPRTEAERYGLVAGSAAAETADEQPELADRKMDELQAIADELEVDHKGVRKKDDLIALIEAAREDAAAAETADEEPDAE